MNALISLLPVFILFFVGLFFKTFNILNKKQGIFLFKIVFFVTLPLLKVRALSSMQLPFTLLVYPLSACIIMVITYIITKYVSKHIDASFEEKTIFIMAAMIINSGFALPFIIAFAGDLGVIRYQFFTLTLSPLIFGWVYTIAMRGKHKQLVKKDVLKKLALSPALIPTIVGLYMNYKGYSIPFVIAPAVNALADLTSPLLLIGLGVLFEHKIRSWHISLKAVFLRMGLGFCIGYVLVSLFGLHGIDRTILLMLASAPVGMNTITLASMEQLDQSFAAQIVSVSIIVGMIILPIISFLF